MIQYEDRISDIDIISDRIVVRDHEKKNLLKIARNHKKSVQQLLDDAKRRLIRVVIKA